MQTKSNNTLTYQPTTGNQISGHCHHCSNLPPYPSPPMQTKYYPVTMLFNKSIIPFTELLPGQLRSYTVCTQHPNWHNAFLHYIFSSERKRNFLSIHGKKTCKNTDLQLKYYFKNMNVYQLKFWKIGTS